MFASAPAFTNSSGIGPLPSFLEEAGGLRMVARVFQSESLPITAASSDTNWIPLRNLLSLFERSAAAVGDDLFGLHVGQAMRPEDFGLWAQYAMSAPSLGCMISRVNKSLRFHQSGGKLELDIQGDLAVWYYIVTDPAVLGRRHHADHAVWPMLTALRRYMGDKWEPLRIECSYDRPKCWRRLEEEFNAPVIFGRSGNAIVFERRFLNNSITHKISPETQVTFGDLRRLAMRRPPTTVLDAARAIMRLRISEPLTDIEGTAHLLGVSTRSLQRHLSEENFTFRDLLEQVRIERGRELLSDSSASVTEIAFALGYNDATSFSRAFRRWTGHPPTHVRRSLPTKKI
jgi:AraC-like DNA-binding protein